jgi:hypothetical protein
MIKPEDVPPMPDNDPIPLTRAVDLTPFPVDAFPEPIANMVDEVSAATQTDPAMAGTSALSAVSACTGGHAEIEIRPGWREPLLLQTATIAYPGERKSAVQMFMVGPLYDVEKQLVEKTAPARLEAEIRKQVAVKAAEKQRNAAAAADPKNNDAAMADAIGAAMIAESIEVPPIPRLVADDITPEAVGSVLAEQGGSLAIISAEGGLFDIIAGRAVGANPSRLVARIVTVAEAARIASTRSATLSTTCSQLSTPTTGLCPPTRPPHCSPRSSRAVG